MECHAFNVICLRVFSYNLRTIPYDLRTIEGSEGPIVWLQQDVVFHVNQKLEKLEQLMNEHLRFVQIYVTSSTRMVLKSYEKTPRSPTDHMKGIMALHAVTKWILSCFSWAEWAQQLARLLLEGSENSLPIIKFLPPPPSNTTKLDTIHSIVPSIKSQNNADAVKLVAYLVRIRK